MDELKRFLDESAMASRVSLPTKVIVHRLDLSPGDIDGVVESGSIAPGDETRTCELVVGGQTLASGRIVRRRGGYYFKVSEMKREES